MWTECGKWKSVHQVDKRPEFGWRALLGQRPGGLKPHLLCGFPKVLSLSDHASQDSSPDLLPGKHRRLGACAALGRFSSVQSLSRVRLFATP